MSRLLLLTLFLLAGLLVSGWQPYDRGTWWLEVAPILVVLPLLWLLQPRFPLTPLLLVLIAAQSAVMMLGGAYTYARVPLGYELQHWLDLSRNPYDRVGHFFQGLVPAIAVREILVRGRFVRTRGMLAFLVCAVTLAISACYEFFEWGTALMLGQGAEDFLATQGDPWDTQWDMFMALVGASCAVLLLSRVHDRQIQAVEKRG